MPKLCALLVMLLLCPLAAHADSPRVQDGALRAPDWDAMHDSPLVLAGEWEVIWGKLVDPKEFDALYGGDHVNMPGRWNRSRAPGFKHSHGVATYRARLVLPAYDRALAFHLVSPNAAWRLYENDILIGGNGSISEVPSLNRPNYTSRIFPAHGGDNVLVLQLANFSHAFGGPGHPLTLWDRMLLRKKLDSMTFFYVLVLGVLLSIGLFHMIFYLADRHDKNNGPVHLWFGLLCFIIAVRISGIIPYFHIYYPHSPYWSYLKLVYLTLFLAPGVYLQFFRAAYPDYFPKRPTRLAVYFCFALSAMVLLTPERLYTHTRDFSIMLNVAVIAYSLFFTLKAMRAHQTGAAVIVVSNFIFFLTALNDALIYTEHAEGFDMTPFGILVLGLGYSYALMLRLQGSFTEAKHTSKALAKLNLELEKQVHERTRAFKAAAARAENSAQEGAQFIAAASHDLRQPLHALAMFNTALQRKIARSSLADLIEKQGRSIRNLGALLQDTLDTARAKTRNKQAVWGQFEVQAMLRQITDNFGIQAKKQGIGLVFSSDEGALVSDRALLQRVLGNLLDNALKAARSQVSLQACSGPKGWTFNVRDDGRGIHSDDAKSIFESYVSLRDEEPGNDGGYGLGLYVVREFCRLLGGSVHIASSTSQGSNFEVFVPHRQEGPGDTLNAGQSLPHELPRPGTRVLAIDDDPDIGEAMRAMLASWECECEIASSGKAAMACLDKGFRPQFLLVDYHLGGAVGLDVIEDIRQRAGASVPAAIITGATEPEIIEKIKASGVQLLPKPVPPERLAALLRACTASDQARLDGESG